MEKGILFYLSLSMFLGLLNKCHSTYEEVSTCKKTFGYFLSNNSALKMKYENVLEDD